MFLQKWKNSNDTSKWIDSQTENVSTSDISNDTSNSDNTPDLSSEHILAQSKETKSRVSNSTKLSEDIIDKDSAETLDFVETVYKEQVSKEIMERIREKKFRDQNSSLDSTSSEPSYENQNLESSIISQSISNSSELSSDRGVATLHGNNNS